MSAKAQLFPVTRACCSCGRAARIRHGFTPHDPAEPDIVTITPVIYVSGAGKAQLKNAPKVQVCLDCLILAIGGTASKPSKQALSLWAAMRNSLATRYSDMKAGS